MLHYGWQIPPGSEITQKESWNDKQPSDNEEQIFYCNTAVGEREGWHGKHQYECCPLAEVGHGEALHSKGGGHHHQKTDSRLPKQNEPGNYPRHGTVNTEGHEPDNEQQPVDRWVQYRPKRRHLVEAAGNATIYPVSRPERPKNEGSCESRILLKEGPKKDGET